MQSNQPPLITLHDAITDSPVYRANVLHFDEQLDHLEKWLETFSRHLKRYTEKLSRFNLETNDVCKKAIPVGVDDTLIDPNFTGAVIRSFSDALQTSLAFKTKLVSDLEDNFLQPLTQNVKAHLKEFKDFRKQHEKALDRYEAQLLRYTSQSKAKEASAVREEAFRLHEARKFYAQMSGQHVVRILQFRSLLEHCLVESFTSATLAHLHDFDGCKHIWQRLDASLASWKQWLVEDRTTCDYQLHRLQAARKRLESEYVDQTRPLRDLERYSASTATPNSNRQSLDFSGLSMDQEQQATKWGYLFTRVSRSWVRKWFFLSDGNFGSCQINKVKGAVSVENCVSVLLCDIKPATDADRRFCFEVVCAQHPPFFLQAETEEEMKAWISAFGKAKRSLIELKSSSSIAESSDPESPRPTGMPLGMSIKSQSTSVLDKASDSNKSPSSGPSLLQNNSHSMVMLSTLPDDNSVSLASSTSLTPHLVFEAAKAQMPHQQAQPQPPMSPTASQSISATMTAPASPTPATAAAAPNGQSSWGFPWMLVPNMLSSSTAEDSEHPPPSPMSPTVSIAPLPTTDSEGHPVVWPTRPDDAHTPKSDLAGYTPELEMRNRELRHLFGGVSNDEMVLDAFICSLKKKPTHPPPSEELDNQSDSQPSLSPTTPTVNTFANLDQDLSEHLAGPIQSPASDFGYSYTGRAFVTQETFWFYSCVLMTCVNTVAVRLTDIKGIRLIRDQSSVGSSVTRDGKPTNVVLAIDLVEANSEPIVLTTLLDQVDVVVERLRLAIDNAKSEHPMPLQTMYDVIRNMSAALSNRNQKTEAITTIMKQPPTKVQSTPDLHKVAAQAAVAAAAAGSANSTPEPSRSSSDVVRQEPPQEKKKRKGRKSSGANKPVPKSGALAAAVMAATVAGGSGFFDASKIARMEEAQKQQQHQQQSVSETSDITTGTNPSTVEADEEEDSGGSGLQKDIADELPPDFKVPSGPCSCDCGDHLDKVEAQVELPISAKRLYEMLFSDDKMPGIWETKTIAGGGKNLKINRWETVDGKQQRLLHYILPVNNPMVKLKEADVVETQIVHKREEHLRYVVQISTKMASLPYADAFIPSVKYCIMWVSKSRCKLICSMGVKFIKSVLVKGMISKAAMKGMGESINQFIPILEDELQKTSKSSSQASTESLDRVGTLRRQAVIKRAPTTRVQASGKDSQSWLDHPVLNALFPAYETGRDLILDMPLYAGAAVSAFILLWFFVSLMRSPIQQNPAELVSTKNTVVSRAVYLRDLREGILEPSSYKPVYVNTESFQLFLATTNRTTDDTYNHQWHHPRHHRMAIDLLLSRERVAMLRHDMLVIFQLLNEVDAQLIENEYINWLLDTRLHCRSPNQAIPANYCEQVGSQLNTLFA